MLTDFERDIGKFILESINMDMDPGSIDPEAPLYSEGLGLDSIDILEISVALSKRFGITINSEEARSNNIFSSLRALSQYIQETVTSDEVIDQSKNS